MNTPDILGQAISPEDIIEANSRIAFNEWLLRDRSKIELIGYKEQYPGDRVVAFEMALRAADLHKIE